MINGELDEAQLISVDTGRMSIRINSFRKLISGGQRNPEQMVSQTGTYE